MSKGNSDFLVLFIGLIFTIILFLTVLYFFAHTPPPKPKKGCDPPCKPPQVCSEIINECITPPKECDPACEAPFKCNDMTGQCVHESTPTQPLMLNRWGLLTTDPDEAATFSYVSDGGINVLLVSSEKSSNPQNMVGAVTSQFQNVVYWAPDDSQCKPRANTKPSYKMHLVEVPNTKPDTIFYIAAEYKGEKIYLGATNHSFGCYGNPGSQEPRKGVFVWGDYARAKLVQLVRLRSGRRGYFKLQFYANT